MLINFIFFIYVITFISYLHDYIRYSGRRNVDVDKFDIIYLHDYITFPGNGILCTLREAGFKRRAFINKRLVMELDSNSGFRQVVMEKVTAHDVGFIWMSPTLSESITLVVIFTFLPWPQF